MSYGPDTIDIVPRSASYVEGEKPADLPVQISLASRTSIGLTSIPKNGATAWIAPN